MRMQDNIYISTSNFQTRDLGDILDLCLRNSIHNLELGSNVAYSKDNIDFVLKSRQYGMKFIIHNYFPTPKDDFVLNLASDNNDILAKSIRLCEQALDLSAVLGAPFYSVHAGFAFHALPKDLNMPQVGLSRILYKDAYEIFVGSIKHLVSYAFKRGVKMVVENNVIAEFNVINGENKLLLLVDSDEALFFYKNIRSDNLFCLIDLGHLKISSGMLGFNRLEYIKSMAPYTIAFHLSENNSRIDDHLKFTEDVWFKDIIFNNRDKILILEANNLKKEEISNTYKAIENMLAN